MAELPYLTVPGWIVRGMVYPAYQVFTGRRILSKWVELEASQWLSGAEMEKRQWEKLQNLLSHAYTHTAFYRERFDQAGIKPQDIRSPEDLSLIPPLTRQELQENKNLLRSNNIDLAKMKPNATGGSSGEPVRFYNDRYELDYRSAAVLRNYRWAGLEPGEPQATIWGSAFDISAAESLGGRLTDSLLNRRFMKAFGLTIENIPRYLKQLKQASPRVITGYTTILVALARAALELEPDFRIEGLRGVVASAENLLPQQRKAIKSAFKAPVFNRYGCREGGAIAHECEAGGLHINAENIFLEIVDKGKPVQDGGYGEIALTMLNNRGFPFIRYLVGDAGRLGDESCSCGRGLPVLGELLGRTQDILITPGGRLVPGAFFPHLFKEVDGVERFQVVQNKEYDLQIRLQAGEGFTEMKRDFLRKQILAQMGEGVSVSFEDLEELPLPPSGKQHLTISECNIDFSKVRRDD